MKVISKGVTKMFYIENATNGELASQDSEGQHDGKTTHDTDNAKAFSKYSKAVEFSQNFNDLWNVVEY